MRERNNSHFQHLASECNIISEMTTIFDGRAFATEKKEGLKIVVDGLKSQGKTPQLASIIIGEDPASKLYVSLKKKAAEAIGAEFSLYEFPETVKYSDLMFLIDSLNTDENVNGVMVQLPIQGELGLHKDEIIGAIDPNKDVDGLRVESQFLHPTSKAIVDILDFALSDSKIKIPESICVVGATGMVGTPLVKELKKLGYKVLEADTKTKNLTDLTKDADVVISATGVSGIIKKDMVKDGVIAIDVGAPSGDFDPEVEDVASFFTPVPGGVGPVTISCLLENLIEAC